MKKILVFLFIILAFMNGFSQINYPITTIFKGDSVIIMTMSQSKKINYLIDSLNKKLLFIKNENKNKEIVLTNLKKDLKNNKTECDYLTEELKLLKIKFDNYAKLDSFKNHVLDLAKLGVILYQKKDGINYYINMRSYKWTIWGNDKIVMIPIRDENKWGVEKMEIYNLPQPDNLSLHLWPHKYNGDKLKFK